MLNAFGKWWPAEHWSCVFTLPITAFSTCFEVFPAWVAAQLESSASAFFHPKAAPSSISSWFLLVTTVRLLCCVSSTALETGSSQDRGP